MNKKEKAKELVEKYLNEVDSNYTDKATMYMAKQCALIAVQDTLDELHQLEEYNYISAQLITGRILYWQGVKEEIKQL